jgi:hypothetical protein
MRKILILLVFVMILSVSGFGQEAEKPAKFFGQLSGSFLFPADGNYKDVYGSSVFYPGIKFGYSLTKSIYLWLGYDYVSKSGTTPELEEEAQSTQHYIGLGAGYQGDFSEKFGYRVQAGVLYISYKEKALGDTVTDSAIGFELEGNLVYYFSERFYGLFVLGYAYGSDDVEDVSIKLGGLKTGIGLGIRF